MTWSDYNSELNRLFRLPGYDVLLKASDFGSSANSDPWFRLASGHCQKEFVSLWQLFDQTEFLSSYEVGGLKFPSCAERFADAIRKNRTKTEFQAIVTCTNSASHLVDAIRAEVETESQPVDVYDLGAFPNPFKLSQITDLKEKRVLIVTDVVASGTLIWEMTLALQRIKAVVVGTVAFAVTGEDYCSVLIANDGVCEYPSERLLGRPPAKRDLKYLESLVTVPIGGYLPAQVPAKGTLEFISIDRASVFPQRNYPAEELTEETGTSLDRTADDPLFGIQELVDHLERCDGVEVDFYQSEERRFTTAVRVHRLLSDCGSDIWKRLRKEFDRSQRYIFVSTCDWRDMAFKQYMARQFKDDFGIEGIPFVMAARTEVGAGPNSFFLLQPSAREILNPGGAGGEDHENCREVVILMASAHTSEALRELVATVAAEATACKITVICLLNRMGDWTLEFTKRIKRMLSGTAGLTRESHFHFRAVYNLRDFIRSEVIRMHDEMGKLLDRLTFEVKHPELKADAQQDKKHTRFRHMTTHAFMYEGFDKPLSLDPNYAFRLRVGSELVAARKHKTKQLLLTTVAVDFHNFEPMIDALAVETEKGRLFHYYALLLGNVGYIKHHRLLDRLRSVLLGRIDELTSKRIADSDLLDEALDQDPTELESHLTLGVALLSLHDSDYDYSDFIRSRLSGGRDPSEYADKPSDYVIYYGSGRWLLATTALIRFGLVGHPTTRAINVHPLVDSLLARAEPLLQDASRLPRTDPRRDRRIAGINRAKSYLYNLERELKDEVHEPLHKTLRFLHSMVLRYRNNHNATVDNMRQSLEFVRNAYERTRRIEISRGQAVGKLRIIELDGDFDYFETNRHKLALGVGGVSNLEEIALRLRDLVRASEYRISQRGLDRYGAANPDSSLLADVGAMMPLLFEVRERKRVSDDELSRLERLWRRIRDELFDGGDAWKFLADFVVPLRDTLRGAIELADAELAEVNSKIRWARVDPVWKPEEEEVYVLADRDLLKQVLKNALKNAWRQETPSSVPRLEIEVDRETGGGDVAGATGHFHVIISSFGPNPPSTLQDPLQTISRHRRDLQRRYDGEIKLEPTDGALGAKVSVTLLSRQGYEHHALPSVSKAAL